MRPKDRTESERRFAASLRALRLARGLTQASLADAVGLHQAEVARYEQGKNVPGLARLVMLADALGVSLDRLAGRHGGRR